ncbi:hypothetical protein ACU6T4_11000 [Avibacterium paragallinarum]|nr:hypothetical protein [Avibacterium paragallinarum]QIR12055.1 hypothetical protein HBL79_07305 [Avibacterium paragallinarum]QJE09125.1 hypothetical protein HHJ62_01735 [Avibacterium paragallinarum]QJE11321.1 hypothetical protein HHJ61_01735 [Avibacterium paragallinarum]QJE13519.1 hypothetical protein HHJ60_01745 [Avibacterium paragallinarum]QJE15718.1 hypothetical protein HHJ59_01730 [Avibacterium paragallinarum]
MQFKLDRAWLEPSPQFALKTLHLMRGRGGEMSAIFQPCVFQHLAQLEAR